MATSVKELHGSIKNAFKNQLDGDSDPFIKRELEQMFADFGPDRSSTAVAMFIRSEQFFSIAKMRDYVPAPGEVKHLYDDNCPDCMNGWIDVPFDELTAERKNKLLKIYQSLEVAREHQQVDRCHCWKGAK